MKLLKTLDKKELLTRIVVGILAIGILIGAYFYATDGRRGNESPSTAATSLRLHACLR